MAELLDNILLFTSLEEAVVLKRFVNKVCHIINILCGNKPGVSYVLPRRLL